MTTQRTVLVTGATGNVGRHVVSGLLAAGVPVRAVTRRPESAGVPGGAGVARADLTDPASLEAVLDGVGPVFLLWPGFATDTAPAVLELLAARTSRVVYLSSMGSPDQTGGRTGPAIFHAEIERHIERSGLEWTFLRTSGFATNTLSWAPEIRADGVVRWSYADARRSLIHERDIAAVAVHALTEDGHGGATHLLSGPEAVTQADQVRTIGEVVGKPVRFEELSRSAARDQMIATGWSAEFADTALDTWAGFVAGPEIVTDGVEKVTGWPARPFREWAVDHAHHFVGPAAVAHQYVALARQGRFDELILQMLAPDIVRVEPVDGERVELRGRGAVTDNSHDWSDDQEIHGVDVGGPYVGDGGRFAVRFAIDTTARSTGVRSTITKLCLYTVDGGRVVREEVFYGA